MPIGKLKWLHWDALSHAVVNGTHSYSADMRYNASKLHDVLPGVQFHAWH